MKKQKNKPPPLANWLASKFINEALLEEFFGDLKEIYEERIVTKGKFYAKCMYWIDTLHLLMGFTSFKLFKTQNNPAMMYKHYLTISIRNLARSKVYSLISVLSLAMGMGVCLTIGQYIYFELSFDKFHDNDQNTYRIIQEINSNEKFIGGVNVPFALGPAGKESIPEIKEYVRIETSNYTTIITNPEKNEFFKELPHDIMYVDPSFFKVFNFPFKSGSKETVFKDKFSVLITEKTAQKYFGADNPIGKTLKLGGGYSLGDYIVSGVLKNPSINSHLQFEFLFPLESVLESRSRMNHDIWDVKGTTYLILDESANPNLAGDKLDQLMVKHRAERNPRSNITLEKLRLQPITDIHLKSDGYWQGNFVINSGNRENLRIFSIIALFILIIAWVNYINLSTARSLQRAKEVGIRKSIGAYRKQLISQFLLESVLVNLLAAILAIGTASLTLPILSNIIGQELALDMLQVPLFWAWFLGVVFVGSLLSGLYPAFILSAFKPVSMLGSNKTARPGKLNLRRGLITFQFLISLLLIAATYLVYKQITFMKNQELGIDMEKILVLDSPGRGLDSSRVETFRTEVTRHHAIATMATSGKIPGKGAGGPSLRKRGAQVSVDQRANFVKVDAHFAETYDFDFLAGGSFTPDMAPDFSTPMGKRMHYTIVNEETVRVLGFDSPQEALHEIFVSGDGPDTGNHRQYRITGVVKNFHWSSLRDAKAPYVFAFFPMQGDYLSIKMNISNILESLDYVEKTYQSIFPGYQFNYFFLDDHFNRQYQAEMQFGNLFLAFTVLAIFIACIGLFALISYSATLRIKEFGIRKVLGAGIGNIMMLLSKEFLVLISIAATLAIPTTLYYGSAWLENYAFRIDIGFDVFIIPGLVLFLSALLTVSHRTYSTAKANPVDSLRTE